MGSPPRLEVGPETRAQHAETAARAFAIALHRIAGEPSWAGHIALKALRQHPEWRDA